MLFIRPAQDAGRFALDGRPRQGRIGQPQGDFVPALGQEIDLHVGRHLHHVLAHDCLVLDFRNHRAHGRQGFCRRTSLVLGRLPQLLEFFVGQEDAATMLFEDTAEFFVGDVDLLLAQRPIGLGRIRLAGLFGLRGIGFGRIGQRAGFAASSAAGAAVVNEKVADAHTASAQRSERSLSVIMVPRTMRQAGPAVAEVLDQLHGGVWSGIVLYPYTIFPHYIDVCGAGRVSANPAIITVFPDRPCNMLVTRSRSFLPERTIVRRPVEEYGVSPAVQSTLVPLGKRDLLLPRIPIMPIFSPAPFKLSLPALDFLLTSPPIPRR